MSLPRSDGDQRPDPPIRGPPTSASGSQSATVIVVERPGKFEEFRWVGDKRTLVVYDVDSMTDESIIDELMEAGTYASFGPDTLAEARNRGYRPFNGTGTNR